MRIIGCDLHARQQAVAMLDTNTGELMEITLTHEGNNVREFWAIRKRSLRRRELVSNSIGQFLALDTSRG